MLHQPHRSLGDWYPQYEKALLRACWNQLLSFVSWRTTAITPPAWRCSKSKKSLPWQAIWEMYCQRHDTPAGSQWLDNVRAYENAVLSQRG